MQFSATLFADALGYIARHSAEIARFTVIGFVTFGINLASFHLFYGLLSLDYITSATLAYPIAVVSHFLLHRFYTFCAGEQAMLANFGKYLIMLAVNYVSTIAVIWLAVEIQGLSPYFGLIASTAISACLNFLMMKHFVFDSKRLFWRS